MRWMFRTSSTFESTTSLNYLEQPLIFISATENEIMASKPVKIVTGIVGVIFVVVAVAIIGVFVCEQASCP